MGPDFPNELSWHYIITVTESGHFITQKTVSGFDILGIKGKDLLPGGDRLGGLVEVEVKLAQKDQGFRVGGNLFLAFTK